MSRSRSAQRLAAAYERLDEARRVAEAYESMVQRRRLRYYEARGTSGQQLARAELRQAEQQSAAAALQLNQADTAYEAERAASRAAAA